MNAATATPAQFDHARFQRLLALVGPDMAPDLLRQLAADLGKCATRIDQGARARDWRSLREASHVLISLAGSAGAEALHGLARALNAAAHDQDSVALSRLLPDLSADLGRLIAFVRATPAPTGGSG